MPSLLQELFFHLMTRTGTMRAGRPHHNCARPFVARASRPRKSHRLRNLPNPWVLQEALPVITFDVGGGFG